MKIILIQGVVDVSPQAWSEPDRFKLSAFPSNINRRHYGSMASISERPVHGAEQTNAGITLLRARYLPPPTGHGGRFEAGCQRSVQRDLTMSRVF